MSVVRTALAWTAAAAATPVFAGAVVLARRGSPSAVGPHRIARGWASLLLRSAGVSVTVSGAPPDAALGPVVLMSNHVSSLDIPVLLSVLDPATRTGFLAKRSLFRLPFLGGAMDALGCISVDREELGSAPGMLAEALAALRSGRSLLVFPEGTWSDGAALLPLRRGGFLLALRARVAIAPLAVEGPQRVLPGGGRLLRPGPVVVRWGHPVPTRGLGVSQLPGLVDEVRTAIESLRRAS